jgi:hypothetical protein
MTRRMEGCPPLEDREGSEGWGWERASRLRWGAKGQDAVTRDLAVMLEGGADTQRPGVRRPRENGERASHNPQDPLSQPPWSNRTA